MSTDNTETESFRLDAEPPAATLSARRVYLALQELEKDFVPRQDLGFSREDIKERLRMPFADDDALDAILDDLERIEFIAGHEGTEETLYTTQP